MKSFAEIQDRAAARKGGYDVLAMMMPTGLKSSEELEQISGEAILAQMTKSIFQSGFSWKVIDRKWPGFLEAFWGFDLMRCAYISPDELDMLASDKRIVRNGRKIATVPFNAAFILEMEREHGSFASVIANWPAHEYVGLMELLKKRASRLGGSTALYFLRQLGRDGFVLNKDISAALIDAGVVDKTPSSKRDYAAVQAAFNAWMEESGLGLAAISRTLALSIDG